VRQSGPRRSRSESPNYKSRTKGSTPNKNPTHIMAETKGDDAINSCLNIMRRMPPSKIEMNLSGLLNLLPELTDDLLQRVDQPLQIGIDETNNKKFIKCDYNRDGDSYRSPWSNQFFPDIEDGFMPPDSLREQELSANRVFDAYRQLYFEGGVSSVYFWELDDTAFAGAFLVKKGRHTWCFVLPSVHIVDLLCCFFFLQRQT
jgi:capping protein beta